MKQTIKYLIFLSMIFSLNANQKIIETNEYLQITQSSFIDNNDNKAIFIFGIDEYEPERLKVQLYESIIEEGKKTNYKNRFDYNFENIGIQRRLNLASLTFDLTRTDPLTNTTYKVDSVVFKYSFKSNIYLNNSTDVKFYTGVSIIKRVP